MTTTTSSRALPTASLVIRQASDGTLFWEAKWRDQGRQIKRRIADGPAWAERDPAGGWRARRGRAGVGTISRDRAAVRAVELVAGVAAEIDAKERERHRQAERPMTFRNIAAEWLEWVGRVKGAKPSTLVDYRSLLSEPGVPYKDGKGKTLGRIMASLGDRDLRDLKAKDIEAFLTTLDHAGLKARNVNKHRQLVCAVFAYACRHDTYELPANVAAQTDKR
ncbi:MAG: hypothetical protein AAGC46_20425, partial [Solirubrobacteraceae bacterium]